MIEIRGLTKVFRSNGGEIVALDNVDLSVASGEIFGIIGLSGAGKSTLVRCINMLERPQSGKIIVDGVDITALSGRELRLARRQIGMIFQHFNLLSSRTAFGNVAFPLEIMGMPRREIKSRVTELLRLVGLEDRASAYPAQLSGGQKQRVGIARALASNPKVLLSDEATSALDPTTTHSILRLLKDINRSLGLTIMLITHEMGVIKEICDRVAVIHNGRIVEVGTVLDIFSHPRSSTAKAFTRDILNLDIPDALWKNNKGLNGKLLRISFIGESAARPVISSVVKKFQVDANILYGKLDYVQDTPFGTLIVAISGDAPHVEGAIEHMTSLGLRVEMLEAPPAAGENGKAAEKCGVGEAG
ncbi:MAG TPA: methionine ABC transporter ATP-binding protein [Firmicutes bacterium]|nr:methionine ABC transporter ATP-binding protein [Bacillota bacterium]